MGVESGINTEISNAYRCNYSISLPHPSAKVFWVDVGLILASTGPTFSQHSLVEMMVWGDSLIIRFHYTQFTSLMTVDFSVLQDLDMLDTLPCINTFTSFSICFKYLNTEATHLKTKRHVFIRPSGILCYGAVVCPSVCSKTLRFRMITQKVLHLSTSNLVYSFPVGP